MTVEQAVQEAAFNGLSVYRGYNEYLANPISDFYHFPAAGEGQEGCYVAMYSDPSSEPDPSRRTSFDDAARFVYPGSQGIEILPGP